MIEPAALGNAVCFGPNTANFRDVVQLLLEADAAVVVQDAGQLENFIEQCLENPSAVRQWGARARRVVSEQTGACAATVAALVPLLSESPAAAPRAA